MRMSGKASVASDRYEPRSRRQRYPTQRPMAVAIRAPVATAIQEEKPSRSDKSALE